MDTSNKNERSLGAQEILFYAMNAASPKHFLIVAEIEGQTTQAAWQAAVMSLQLKHPMLRMSIIADENDLSFAGSKEPLFLDIADLPDPFDLNLAIEAELEKGFQSHKGPLARIKLFHSRQKCIVIISAHHSVADALSSVNLLNDLLGLLSGNYLPQDAAQPSVDELLGYDNQDLAAKLNKQIRPGIPLPHEFLKQHPPAKIDILHFSKELTARLAESAKKHGTTVHGALQAAAALSLKELAFDVSRPAYIMSPFSVRADLNIGTDCGLFIDTKIVAVSTDQDTDFWEIARSAKDGFADVHTGEFLRSSDSNCKL